MAVRGSRHLRHLVTVLLLAAPLVSYAQPRETDPATGLVTAPGLELVKANCTACHSAALITQNRASRDGWLTMIRWMQDTQRLWPLGDSEGPILDYLAANYSPRFSGRRAPLPASLLPPMRMGPE